MLQEASHRRSKVFSTPLLTLTTHRFTYGASFAAAWPVVPVLLRRVDGHSIRRASRFAGGLRFLETLKERNKRARRTPRNPAEQSMSGESRVSTRTSGKCGGDLFANCLTQTIRDSLGGAQQPMIFASCLPCLVSLDIGLTMLTSSGAKRSPPYLIVLLFADL